MWTWPITRKRAHSNYFQAEATIIMHVSLNSESDTEDVRSRKVYTMSLARAKCKTFFLCCLLLRARSKLHAEQNSTRYTWKPRTALSTWPHLPWSRYTVRIRSVEVMIKSLIIRKNILLYLWYTANYIFKLMCGKNEHREFISHELLQ